MKTFTMLLFFSCLTGPILAQSITLKQNAGGQQVRVVFPISEHHFCQFTGNEIKRNLFGLRFAVGMGASLELASQVSVTFFRAVPDSRPFSVQWAGRVRHFAGKELFPLDIPTYHSIAFFGAIFKDSGGHLMSYYLQYKRSEKLHAVLCGTVHRVSKKLALTIDLSWTSKLTQDLIEEAATPDPGLTFKAGAGVLFYF